MHPPADETKGVAGPPGTLTLVATPIGNLDDMPARGIAVLAAADAVLCEDTRVTAKLAARHGIAPSLAALHEHNEDAMIPRVLARLAAGERLALVTDAGTPLVSDPGYRLVRAAIAAGHRVTAVPGPSAALAALAVSGLPPAPFLFLGFLPPKAGPRRARIGEIARLEAAGLGATLVLFEAPQRLGALLADLAAGLGGERPAAVARELTKLFEEVARGTLGALAARYAGETPRGEIVVVVGPAPPQPAAGDAIVEAMLRDALARGLGVRDAAAAVATATGRPRREVYARALRASGRE
ncbi:16S rRNA (cytidine(1402)-2'-O)-methyltransferase [Elioraea sp. Yellowstone]|jgi:16S rRNA (cytidine1402-2'-O)-methyltransferase|uniref:16S rRNA (cytidine(1402)-2'-O)-methyltransferase n=1 Tax=Elioraea sp. Yellowstone TaxID=2592070 RepID=UPI001154E981|nr:16S rRNA (cytidine(1402)-2'-O)-methyltransferase [Elioraea sp. Yellowstone]TQF76745.1 16S rRNA (cytidine(1402)-2'-O)-methyltransferase [Elioraea sp. Yellowstone]